MTGRRDGRKYISTIQYCMPVRCMSLEVFGFACILNEYLKILTD
jgi:hypothetical protein